MTLNEFVETLTRIIDSIDHKTNPDVEVGDLEFRHPVEDVFLDSNGKVVILI